MEFHLTEPEDTIITLEEGSPGLSAYELALSKGFEGTLEEWLNSLKGADGSSDIPTPPSEGTYVLKVVDGVFSWAEDSSESGLTLEVESFLYADSDYGNILSYNPPNVPLNYPPENGMYVIMFKLNSYTEVRRVEINIGGVWTHFGPAYRADTQIAGAEGESWFIMVPYDFNYVDTTELPITLDTQFKISVDNDEVIVTTPINYMKSDGPFSVTVTGHSTDGGFLPVSEPISFPDGAMYVRFETDAVTPFDGLEIWDFNTGDWYIANVVDSIVYDALGQGKHLLVWETANTIYKPFEFPETFMLQYKFIKGNNEAVVEDTITFSSDTVEILPINLHNRSVDGMVSWQTLSTPVSLEDISSYSVWYYADYAITPDPGWPGTIEYAEYSESSLDWVTVPTESIQHYEESSWTFTPNITYTKQTPTPNGQVQILYRFTSGGRVTVLNDIIDVVE